MSISLTNCGFARTGGIFSTSRCEKTFHRAQSKNKHRRPERWIGKSAAFLLALCAVFTAANASALVFTVTTTADSGPGSLRQAILDANANAGADTIAFIIGSGIQTIAFSAKLPDITDAVTIDGTTQPGYSGTPLIRLDGGSSSSFGKFNALTITAGNSTVKALDIGRYKDDGTGTGYGIVLSGNGGNVIKNCYIGVDVDGVTRRANAQAGILINGSANNIIGGTTAAERNVISGNSSNGLEITGSGATGNTVKGNYIGTTATGNAFLGNFSNGVAINGAPNNTIGGTTGTTPGGACTGACNVISNSTLNGVKIFGSGATGNQVQGNFIGTNVNGTATGMGNGLAGAAVLNVAGNTVGGAAPGARNIISGNLTQGVFISGTNNLVAGNYIGTDTTGNNKIGNSDFGVVINGPASNNTVGGTVAGAGNVISGNGGGVEIAGGDSAHTATGNVIAGNYIGVKATGTAALGNTNDGVLIASAGNNTIGGSAGTAFQGPCTGACNVISGNGGNGVELNGNLTTGSLVQGNYIGTDVNGAAAIGNGLDGIVLVFGAHDNVIGNPPDTPIASTEAARGTSGPSATTEITYDKCIQEGNLIFKWNSVTGDYAFIKCIDDGNVTERGQGTVDNSHTFLNIISGKDFNGNDFKAEIDGYNMRGSLFKLLPIGGVTKIITDLNTSASKCDCGRPQLVSSNIGKGIRADTADNNTIRRLTLGGGPKGTESLPNGSNAISLTQTFNNHDDENSMVCTTGVPCVDHQSGIGDTFLGNSYVDQASLIFEAPGANNNQAPPVLSGCAQTSTTRTQCTQTIICSPNTQCIVETYGSGPGPLGTAYQRFESEIVTADANGHATVTAIFDPGPSFNFTTNKIAATTTDPTNGTSAFSTLVPATPSSTVTDLALTMTGSPNPAMNSNITYTIGVSNNGPATAPNTVVIDILPLAVNFISATSTVGNCTNDASNNIVTCNLGSLTNGGSATVTIVVAPTATGTFGNFAGVSSDITDNNRTNNGIFVETVVNSPSATPTPTPTTGSLGNVSTRLQVGTGNNVLFAGFIIQGSASKTVLIRSAGPSLTPFGVPGAMGNPQLELHDANNTIGTNDNWQTTQLGGVITSDQVQAIRNSGAAPADPAEPAIIATLPAGQYTAIVQGVGGTQGVATVEVYDLSPNNGATLVNISTRGFIQTGDNVMIGGFIIVGQASRVIVLATGPSLIPLGINNALANPRLELHDANGTLAGNDDWQTTQLGGIITSDQSAAIQNSGLAPKDPAESAIIATLAPGNYTAIAQGVNGGTGVGTVQVFALP